MEILNNIKDRVLDGERLTKGQLLELYEWSVEDLQKIANEVQKKFCSTEFDLCSIVNAKSGLCYENCFFCAQSIFYNTGVKKYDLLAPEEIAKVASYNFDNGVKRFSVVTSGGVVDDIEMDKLVKIFSKITAICKINLCASTGALTLTQFKKLKECGVSRYHCNLEAGKNFFSKICTTHTYVDKLKTIEIAKEAGLEICSGGIIGLGETIADRIDMAIELRNLDVKSIPINILNPIKGTPLENNKILSFDEIAKTVAIFRLALPDAFIRLAGGRVLIKNMGRDLFGFGINAVITGDMLTTSGAVIEDDINATRSLL